MSGCGCHSAVPGVGAAEEPIDLTKKKCSPCEAAARAIVSATPNVPGQPRIRVGAASDDLQTLQAFLQSLTSGVAPTQSELNTAQQAASNLSTEVLSPVVVSAPPIGTVNVKTTAIAMMLVGGIGVGVGLAYLYKTSPKRRTR